jgi:hypothetical protein
MTSQNVWNMSLFEPFFFKPLFGSKDPDPHQSETQDPDPDSDPYQSDKQDPDPHPHQGDADPQH